MRQINFYLKKINIYRKYYFSFGFVWKAEKNENQTCWSFNAKKQTFQAN